MNFKLSKYIIKTDNFKEQGDKNEYTILFSCRKKMGIKMNVKLVKLLEIKLFSELPDSIFSMLMHYEIIIPEDEHEEEHLYNTRRLLFKGNNISERKEPKKSTTNLLTFLKKENVELKNKIGKKEFVDLVNQDIDFSLIFSDGDGIYTMNIDDPELYKTPIINKKKLCSYSNHHKLSYLLPISNYNANFSGVELKSIIDNFKLKLILKYKIEA